MESNNIGADPNKRCIETTDLICGAHDIEQNSSGRKNVRITIERTNRNDEGVGYQRGASLIILHHQFATCEKLYH